MSMTHTNSFFLQHLGIYTKWPIYKEKTMYLLVQSILKHMMSTVYKNEK